MDSDNLDFIIKNYINEKTGKSIVTLRRYKGKDELVVIPDGVEKIADYVFADDLEPNDTIKKIIIPDSVLEISYHSFEYCLSLEEIRFPNKLRHFFVDFDYCPSLHEITVPDSVEKIGNLHCTETLKKINVGPNINHVALTTLEKDKPIIAELPRGVAEVLLSNPSYEVRGDFLVNIKHGITLFRLFFEDTTVRIPDGIKILGPNTFYELYQYSIYAEKMKPVEKVIIPASVEKINDHAFFYCNSLKEVVYEGLSRDIEISEAAFLMCVDFHRDGREIICKDTFKKKNKNTKTTNLRIERIVLVYELIKDGGYPNKDDIIEFCKKKLGLGKYSDATFYRDKTFLETRFNAPIKYDDYHKGYCLTDENYTLNLLK